MFFRLALLLAFGAVIMKLWDLQIISSQAYQAEADMNRFRVVQIDAPRGIIYDREGRLLVRNVPSFSVNITPGALPSDSKERYEVLKRLANYLDMPVRQEDLDQILYADPNAADQPLAVKPQRKQAIESIIALRYNGQWTPIRIASNVARDIAFMIDEDQSELPGVTVEAEPIREYLEGDLMSHFLGYVGRISASAWPDYEAQKELKYQKDDLVGLTGIEATQESFLRGMPGQKHIQVDAYEREVSVIAQEDPIPGANIRLTIDTEFQRAVRDILAYGMERSGAKVGVAVVLDPRTGEVMASVSLPTYDNNLFSGGISYDDFMALNSNPHHPMIDHAVSGQYPPGSTFKVIPAAAALNEGIISLGTSVTCRGTLRVPNKYYPDDPKQAQTFYCWARWGHGVVSVREALMGSCDIFFYEVGGGFGDFEGLGINLLGEYMSLFGLGARTGIELTGEARGLVPTAKWKVQNYGEAWALGDTYNAAIGQGFVLVTPMQLANATAAIANGGTLFKPQVIAEITDTEGNVIRSFTPEVIRELPISDDVLAYIRSALRDTVNEGTASRAKVPGIAVAGKTGSAEYAVWDKDGNLVRNEFGVLPSHAWFIAFAPYDAPEIVVTVFLEGGGTGAEMAAPVAGNIIRAYYGIPQEEISGPTGQIID